MSIPIFIKIGQHKLELMTENWFSILQSILVNTDLEPMTPN